MIDKVLVFLRARLDAYLRAQSTVTSDAQSEKVVFVDGKALNSLEFPVEAVSLLLINVEEERALRAADPYSRVTGDGSRQNVQPDIRLNLYLLFVARSEYAHAWGYLSHVIEYFQTHRVLDQESAPDLDDGIDRLTMELITLDFSAQNEVWNALRVTQHPAVLYKVQLVVFSDQRAMPSHEILETEELIREARG